MSSAVSQLMPEAPAMLRAMLYGTLSNGYKAEVEYVGITYDIMEAVGSHANMQLRSAAWRLISHGFCELPFGHYPKREMMRVMVSMLISDGPAFISRGEAVLVYSQDKKPLPMRLRELLIQWASEAATEGRRPISISLNMVPALSSSC
jgi:hypothetical protein